MRVSLRWLQDYIDLQDLSLETISATLTQLGLEVEGIERVAPLQGEVVVGHIKSARPHPNADKLQVCEVDLGSSETLTIVCGAPNARAGLKVVVARIGSVLPPDFKIKESKIRGQDSFGMLCSQKELGLTENHDGILELPATAPLGLAIADYLQLNDSLLEISVTPNRSDCLGIIGLARDLATRLGRPLKIPQQHPAWLQEDLDSAQHIRVQLAASEDSQRFTALYVRDVRAVASPLWMQRRLQQAGMRPINLIVDATNYAMLESGQPIHAYDERDIKGGLLQVRRGREQEILRTLDGQERSLNDADLVIADASKNSQAVGLAGIMGGENSEVKADTQHIVIEVAQFNPTLIRKTAKRFGLRTEASHRFERGVDVEQLAWVARRTAELIYQGASELRAAGQNLPLPAIAGRLVDVYPDPKRAKEISLRLARLRRLSGLDQLEAKDAIAILQPLGFVLKEQSAEATLWQVPPWRHDMELEADLIEEVVRVYGYDKIPSKLPKMTMAALPEHPLIEFTDSNKIVLATLGLSEVITFPFMGREDFAALGIEAPHPLAATLQLANPLVEQQSHMRSTLVASLLRCVIENRRHGIQGVKLFEAGRSFHEPRHLPANLAPMWAHLAVQGDHIPRLARNDDRVHERNRIAGILDQPYFVKSWHQAETPAGFFQGKSLLLQYLSAFGISELQFTPIDGPALPWLHPGAAASISSAAQGAIGYVGELHPATAKAYGLDAQQTPVVFELDLEALLRCAQEQGTYASSSVKFPPVARDLALVVPLAISYADFMQSFKGFKRRQYLRDYRLFDVYQGAPIAEGKKSMAFSLHFQSEERTLTDQDVEKEVEALLSWLKSDLSADLR